MHPQFLSLLCCPKTFNSLHLDSDETASNGMVIRGKLTSQTGTVYPIIKGIPRFVNEEHYASSFGYEWNRWPRVQFESENSGKPMAGHTLRMWEAITELGDQTGKSVVEFGCGPGRFLDIVRKKGGQAIGIDLSLAAETARQNFSEDSDVLIVQGDLSSPPFRNQVFDDGYTIGVLHHTPSPVEGLKSLTRTVKTGGQIAVSVYPRGEFYDFKSVARWRAMTHHLKGILGYKPAIFYSLFSAYVFSPLISKTKHIAGIRGLFYRLERNWLPALAIPDAQWRVLDIFDAITPTIATTHSGDEVRAWMVEAGCTNIHATKWGTTSLVGIKT